MRFSTQNLNDKPGGRQGSIFRYGRGWLYFGDGSSNIGLEWVIPTWRFAASINFAGNHALCLNLSCLLFGLYITLDYYKLEAWLRHVIGDYEDREISIRVHDWSLWWNFWTPSMSWSSKTPKYRNGCFHPVDFLFGRMKRSAELIKKVDIEVPMPEGVYKGTAKFENASWRRPRWPWPWHRSVSCHIELEKDIPVPGKGENSWDCDEDATHAMYCSANTPVEAVVKIVESVLSCRYQRAGLNWRPSSEPRARVQDAGDTGAVEANDPST